MSTLSYAETCSSLSEVPEYRPLVKSLNSLSNLSRESLVTMLVDHPKPGAAKLRRDIDTRRDAEKIMLSTKDKGVVDVMDKYLTALDVQDHAIARAFASVKTR